jgi:hypothetical protein
VTARPPDPEPCDNQHAAAPRSGAKSIEWEPSTSRVHRIRVRAHTCSCTFPYFELCTAGGLWFVRRFTAKSPAVAVESPWVSAHAAQNLWTQILTGQAR